MYKEITVCINETEGRDNTIRTAAQFATQVGARLNGLYVRNSIVYSGLAYGMWPDGMVADDLIKLADDRERKLIEKASESFQTIVNEFKCETNWLETTSEEEALRSMIYADLIITNQNTYDPRGEHSNIGFINTLILTLGKPIVLVPSEWKGTEFGKKVVIGWNESREASRAVHDAMPILQSAINVDTVCVNFKEHDKNIVDVSEISSYLTRHNVPSDFHLKLTDDEVTTPEEVLRKYSDEAKADLIVVGAYGHTRLREIVMGGVTRDLSKNSTIPVMFSH